MGLEALVIWWATLARLLASAARRAPAVHCRSVLAAGAGLRGGTHAISL
jgi:hypothetical protein